jgi:hypothetical protein
MVGLDSTLIRKYGLPTAIAAALLLALLWTIQQDRIDMRAERAATATRLEAMTTVIVKVDALSDDVNFLSRLVDDRCPGR